jgi:hypothetical protein
VELVSTPCNVAVQSHCRYLNGTRCAGGSAGSVVELEFCAVLGRGFIGGRWGQNVQHCLACPALACKICFPFLCPAPPRTLLALDHLMANLQAQPTVKRNFSYEVLAEQAKARFSKPALHDCNQVACISHSQKSSNLTYNSIFFPVS